ncbi:transcriptional regulator [Micromonospora echinospora]|uniref:Transcriptional regulator, contains XRE-family HTH domain n=1 Tax=Micromonospora echinospora TaxID=1877 RepID=A0A1C5A9J1_MICEC|nr:helix-turn-helix transcriptional regulator [Micromonospora echinospora]OZV78848.1 transcriptional regulator [Micromonospora echinospora]SCF41887.1 Transcriptional regulator, contains XRE-family HTH domain [Micromonospora echinospora]
MEPIIGENLAAIRQQSTLTQEQLAERAGVDVGVIRKLEQGARKSARLPTLHALARALGVPTSALIGDTSHAAARAEPDHRPLSLAEIRRAVAPVRGLAGTALVPPASDPPEPEVLRARLHTVDRAYHANDYARVLADMPALLHDVRAAADLADERDRAGAYTLLTQTLHLTGNLLIQLRASDLAFTALSGALDAARRAGNQAVATTVIQGMCWVLVRQGRFVEAAELAVTTADQVEPRFSRAAPDELAAWGWLLLGAAAARARNNEPDVAAELTTAAAAAAVRIGQWALDPTQLIMVGGFSVDKVQMQRAENAAVAGDPGRVLELAKQVPPGSTATASCWQRHRLDVSWAYAEQRRYADATEVLLDLRATAPAWLRQQRYARDIVQSVSAQRRRAMSQELADLAALVGA